MHLKGTTATGFGTKETCSIWQKAQDVYVHTTETKEQCCSASVDK